jgi:glycosyltransferase involved in cell wall biosynthesis
VRELIKASQLLYKKFPGKFKLTIVGSRDSTHPKSINDYEMSLIRNSDYINYIPYTGNISKILALSDVFVLPSYREGLSRSAMEACSIGRPLIVSNVPGVAELVINGVNGFLCNPKEYVTLYQAMSNFFDIDAKTIVDMGKESYSIVSKRYDIDTVYKIFNRDIIEGINCQ